VTDADPASALASPHDRGASGRSGRFRVERHRGSAQALHDLSWPEPLGPTVWLLEVERPALVLGSVQGRDRTGTVTEPGILERAGVEVAVRSSGGGAVLVEPGQAVWVDVVIPRPDPAWDDDVGRAFVWLGRAWASALGTLGLDAAVHTGSPQRRRAGMQVCFAGLGAGEVHVDGAKAVGLSQRRTRVGARFQALCYRRWNPAPLAALGIDPAAVPAPVPVDHDPEVVIAALLRALAEPRP
jgi:lipoate---protein ligase